MTDQERPRSPESTPLAAVVCDAAGVVTAWSEGAQRLTGHRAQDVIGHPVSALIEEETPEIARLLSTGADSDRPARIRHRDGHTIHTGIQVVVLPDGDRGHQGTLLLIGSPTPVWEDAELADQGAMAAYAFDQLPWPSAVYDLELRLRYGNEAMLRLLNRPEAELRGRKPTDLLKHHGAEIEQSMREALARGERVTRMIHPDQPGHAHEHTWALHIFPLKDDTGNISLLCGCGVELSSQDRVQERLSLVDEASRTVGSTLNVSKTAEELVQVLVPGIADFATVDLLESVFGEQEPVPGAPAGSVKLRRVAMDSVLDGCPESVLRPGQTEIFPEFAPHTRCMNTGQPSLTPFLSDPGFRQWTNYNPQRMTNVRKFGIHSAMLVPLRARGTTLGVAVFVRHQSPGGFGTDDLLLAQEIAARAAVSIDNALRYTRQRNTAVALQRRLLPQRLPQQSTMEVTGRYLPSDGQVGVGGDWYDVIPLSGARVALVVGDVVGHGIEAAAAMGRLRTAVRTLADTELPPDELLTHLDDLVTRPFAPDSALDEEAVRDAGTTCLYAVYDPVMRRCTMARAGHPEPVLVRPDGSAELVDVPAGPPLGLGNQPFETREMELAPGSLLALYTNGLVVRRGQDMDHGLARLLEAFPEPTASLEETCDTVVRTLLPGRSEDDTALLLARTRALPPDHVATWDFSANPTVVGQARERVAQQLGEWGLDDLVFSTEIIVTELVTNGIRHASGPIRLRLILESTLICEVTDHSHTYPHQRRARTLDETGRGLFLVAQLSQRWGTRATDTGKIVWADQILPTA